MNSDLETEATVLFARDGEFAQAYSENVHILASATMQTLLARLSSPKVRQPEMSMLLRSIYTGLFWRAIDGELDTKFTEVPTRMAEAHPKEGVWRGAAVDPMEQLVFVDVIRAGIVPAQFCYEWASMLIPDDRLRIDHLTMARVSDSSGRVVGVDLSGSKIGGSIEGRILVLPDPMGATGSTTLKAIDHYLKHHGTPKKIITLPMISTPEYLRAVLDVDNLVVYTARLDRGMSSDEVLASPPGVYWDDERGLNENSYIVPGAGGIGEVLNNAWC